MKDDQRNEWLHLAERLFAAAPEKFEEALHAMHDLVDATEVIASFDWQLMGRGRPRKQYRA